MSEANLMVEVSDDVPETASRKAAPDGKLPWETPKIEDVSEEVMAQPYIRFT